jgi:hypothetical protein
MKANATATVKKAASTAGKFGSAAAGLAAGTLVMSKLPAVGPPIVQKALPGLVGMGLAYIIGKKSDNDYIKSAAVGLGLAGFVNLLKNNFAQYLPAIVTDNLQLKGLGIAGNYGQYPPEFFTQQVNGMENGTLLSGMENGNVLNGLSDANRLLIG